MINWLRKFFPVSGFTKRFRRWTVNKWRGVDEGMLISYQATFENTHGDRVLQHLLDSIYCTICTSNDPYELAAHNARRAVVHEILINLQHVETLQKQVPVNKEKEDARRMV